MHMAKGHKLLQKRRELCANQSVTSKVQAGGGTEGLGWLGLEGMERGRLWKQAELCLHVTSSSFLSSYPCLIEHLPLLSWSLSLSNVQTRVVGAIWPWEGRLSVVWEGRRHCLLAGIPHLRIRSVRAKYRTKRTHDDVALPRHLS